LTGTDFFTFSNTCVAATSGDSCENRPYLATNYCNNNVVTQTGEEVMVSSGSYTGTGYQNYAPFCL